MNCIICGKELNDYQIKIGKSTCSKSCAIKLKWQDPEHKEKMKQSIKKAYESQELRNRISLATKNGFNKNNSREKISKASKQRWSNSEYKEKIKNLIKLKWQDEDYRNKMSIAHKNQWLNPEYKNKMSKISSTFLLTEEVQNKINNTKRKNHTFNTSKPEQETYKILKELFSNVQTQHKDERYPYNCDFYIKELDLFIECNYYWTHQNELYDETNEEHRKIIESWKNKNTKFYDNAIDTWTRRDVEKMKCAHENKLNYIVFYSFDEFIEWINCLH